MISGSALWGGFVSKFAKEWSGWVCTHFWNSIPEGRPSWMEDIGIYGSSPGHGGFDESQNACIICHRAMLPAFRVKDRESSGHQPVHACANSKRALHSSKYLLLLRRCTTGNWKGLTWRKALHWIFISVILTSPNVYRFPHSPSERHRRLVCRVWAGLVFR